MNFVFLSPHFPLNYIRFASRLRELGAAVLGIADEPYERLPAELKQALTEYYWVPNMHDYDALVRGLGYFTHRYGKLGGIDSHNEYWLETEARLRTDFNIPGLRIEAMPPIKRKSRMKAMFAKAGVPVAPGKLIRIPADAIAFAAENGYPLIAKPDIGVGAHHTYRFDNAEQLNAFLDDLPEVDYILEKFITGDIQTFDGLVDHEGRLVFSSSMQYSRGVMETVNEDSDIYYFTLRTIPPDVEEAGRSLLGVYGIRSRFFHFEFFRTPDGALVGLEVNMRPPGGLTTDMFNFTNDIDVYREWANIVMRRPFSATVTRPYHCCYIGRKNHRLYRLSHEDVLARLGDTVVHHEPVSGVFSAALGNYGYVVRSPDLEEIHAIAALVLGKEETA